jgi:hydroxymethylglutaryl-CoA synthase
MRAASSRYPGFYNQSWQERLETLVEQSNLDAQQAALLRSGGLDPSRADHMIENVVGVYSLPFALATNFVVNGRELLVPMVVEEPSVVAGASNMAKLVRSAGGFQASATDPLMIGQIQLLDLVDLPAARARIQAEREHLLELANRVDPILLGLGGGAHDLEIREIPSSPIGPFLVVHLLVDVRDAMGGNVVNTACERLAPELERITGGRVHLRILSNLADRRLARAECHIPAEALAFERYPGERVRDGIVEAYAFAASDPYRAATHNKGILNGVDAVVVATGNDWRAVEAGAHAYAARSGSYTSLSTWERDAQGPLVGRVELPLAVGVVGGATRVHPLAKLSLQILGVESARGLAEISPRWDWPRTWRRCGPWQPRAFSAAICRCTHAKWRWLPARRERPSGPLPSRWFAKGPCALTGHRNCSAESKGSGPNRSAAPTWERPDLATKREKDTIGIAEAAAPVPSPQPAAGAARHVMRPVHAVGILGYGAYLPRYRLPAREVARVWTDGAAPLPVQEKSVAGLDEDVVTMSIEAARNALARAGIPADQIGALWVGSESHPYAVKPTSTIVAEAIGASPHLLAADWEFACKAGTEALQAAIGLVGSQMVRYAIAIGMDTAQGRPGDALEYTTGAGGAALVVGPGEESLAVVEASTSYVTDTPDFWRRAEAPYPQHGQRFTGEPAYFKHVQAAAQEMMEALALRPSDYRHAVFHQPNTKFPQRVAADLGFTREQIRAGLLVPMAGNTYAGAALLGLTAVLDEAEPGDRILLVSFGSGAGSDAFSLRVTEALAARRGRASSTRDYLGRRKEIDYALYARLRGKLRL